MGGYSKDYLKRRMKEGLCIHCDTPRVTSRFCEVHRLKQRVHDLNYRARKRGEKLALRQPDLFTDDQPIKKKPTTLFDQIPIQSKKPVVKKKESVNEDGWTKEQDKTLLQNWKKGYAVNHGLSVKSLAEIEERLEELFDLYPDGIIN